MPQGKRPRVFGEQVAKGFAQQLVEGLPSACSPIPADKEIEQIRKGAKDEHEACVQSYQLGWGRGMLIGGAIVLAGVALLAISMSGREQ